MAQSLSSTGFSTPPMTIDAPVRLPSVTVSFRASSCPVARGSVCSNVPMVSFIRPMASATDISRAVSPENWNQYLTSDVVDP